jgi:DNA-3-methyladenine glycosylase II
VTAPTPADEAVERAAAHTCLMALDDPIAELAAELGPIAFYEPTMSVALPDELSAMTLHIVGQMISRAAALAVFNRLREWLGGTIDARRLAAASEDELRAVGLSYAKARALRALAEQIAAGAFDFAQLHTLDDDAALRRLVSLRGVGEWSAQVFMLRDLRRPDVFPGGDIGLRNSIATLDRAPVVPGPRAAAARALPWRPYRSYAASYLWRAYARARPLTLRAPPG